MNAVLWFFIVFFIFCSADFGHWLNRILVFFCNVLLCSQNIFRASMLAGSIRVVSVIWFEIFRIFWNRFFGMEWFRSM